VAWRNGVITVRSVRHHSTAFDPFPLRDAVVLPSLARRWWFLPRVVVPRVVVPRVVVPRVVLSQFSLLAVPLFGISRRSEFRAVRDSA
jgi:hypothetical protein